MKLLWEFQIKKDPSNVNL